MARGKRSDTPELALREAISNAGGVVELAARLSASRRRITHQAICQWRVVPPGRVLAVEAVTGVSRHRLRPDYYPVERARK